MPSNCDKCKLIIRNGQNVKCKGGCSKEFCAKCTGLSDYDIKNVLTKPNILYVCDSCMDYKEAVTEKFQQVLNEVSESKIKIIQQESDIKRILNELKSISKAEDRGRSEIMKSANQRETYADRVRGEPPLIIKPKAKQDPLKTKEDLKKKVDPSDLKITGISAKQSGVITIKSKSREETLKIKQAVEKNLGESYEVKVPVIRNLKVYVRGMTSKWGEEEIINKIKCQNEVLEECYMKCVKVIENRKTKQIEYSAIIEIDNDGFKKAMGCEKINIGWDRCRVYDGITVKRCYKCLGYNHKSTECRNKEVCGKCHGSHDTRECSNENVIEKCINCEKANEKLKLNLKCDHSVWSRECPVYLNKIRLERRKLGF